MKPLRGFSIAVSFLTRIPIRHRTEPDMGLAVPWFPVVGLLVGLAVGVSSWMVASTTNPLLGAACGVTIGILVTGAFHEDGLADVADAFVGGWNQEDRLRILKDPRHGTYGVVALVASIGIRVIALGSIPLDKISVCAATAHCLSRAGSLGMMLVGKPATSSGLGADYVRGLRRRSALISLVFVIGTSVLLVGPQNATLIIFATFATTTIIKFWSERKISGISGDVLGATQQVNEILILVLLAVIFAH